MNQAFHVGITAAAIDPRAQLSRYLQLRLGPLGNKLVVDLPMVFSPLRIFATQPALRCMQETLRLVSEVVNSALWQQATLANKPAICSVAHGTHGIFNALDFHTTHCCTKLIEINTNAGGGWLNLGIAAQMLAATDPDAHKLEQTAQLLEEPFVSMFHGEWQRFGAPRRLSRVAIVDTEPGTQFLYPEFLLAQAVLRANGIDAVIADPREFEYRSEGVYLGGQRIDFVYNRLTDFYLDEPQHAELRAAWDAAHVCLSPNPRVYALWADKSNLITLTSQDALTKLEIAPSTIAGLACLIPRTIAVTAANEAELWAARKSLFFKPETGFGSKATYRGAKLTKTTWKAIVAARYVAQEMIDPEQVASNDPPGQLKVDLRAFAYEEQLQLVCARLYSGQTTNFRTPGGGFAGVDRSPEQADC